MDVNEVDVAIEEAWPGFIASLQKYITGQSRTPYLWDHSTYGHTEQGQLSQDANEQACRQYTLSYAMTHAIALYHLLKHNNHKAILLNHNAINAILHIDFGCGPGSALWALLRLAKKCNGQRLTSLGYDHNPHILKLAGDIKKAIKPQIPANFEVDQDLAKFRKRIEQYISVKYDVVLVTINALFGQDSFQNKRLLAKIINDIERLQKYNVNNIPILIAGTHPSYRWDQVQLCFDAICQCLNGKYLYNDKIKSL